MQKNIIINCDKIVCKGASLSNYYYLAEKKKKLRINKPRIQVICKPPQTNDHSFATVSTPFSSPRINSAKQTFDHEVMLPNKRHWPQPLELTESNLRNAHKKLPKLFGCKFCAENNLLEQNLLKHYLKNHQTNKDRGKNFDINC